jgi:hypothetical protein
VESSGGGGDNRYEPVVLSLKPLVVLDHLGAVGPVERVLVTGVFRAPPADRVNDGPGGCGTVMRASGCLPRVVVSCGRP